VHIDETRAVEPLEGTSEWHEGERPETDPTGIWPCSGEEGGAAPTVFRTSFNECTWPANRWTSAQTSM
jgi:hypothetical protein